VPLKHLRSGRFLIWTADGRNGDFREGVRRLSGYLRVLPLRVIKPRSAQVDRASALVVARVCVRHEALLSFVPCAERVPPALLPSSTAHDQADRRSNPTPVPPAQTIILNPGPHAPGSDEAHYKTDPPRTKPRRGFGETALTASGQRDDAHQSIVPSTAQDRMLSRFPFADSVPKSSAFKTLLTQTR